MRGDECCPFLRQAQNYFLSWASWLETDQLEFSEILSVANRLYPNLLTETDEKGKSVFHFLCESGPEWLVEYLLQQKKAILTAPDFENGWNPAHRAAYFGQSSIFVFKFFFFHIFIFLFFKFFLSYFYYFIYF